MEFQGQGFIRIVQLFGSFNFLGSINLLFRSEAEFREGSSHSREVREKILDREAFIQRIAFTECIIPSLLIKRLGSVRNDCMKITDLLHQCLIQIIDASIREHDCPRKVHPNGLVCPDIGHDIGMDQRIGPANSVDSGLEEKGVKDQAGLRKSRIVQKSLVGADKHC